MTITLPDGTTLTGNVEECTEFLRAYRTDLPTCECPPHWSGLYPPTCPLHNPSKARISHSPTGTAPTSPKSICCDDEEEDGDDV